jgi:hypothetical protein
MHNGEVYEAFKIAFKAARDEVYRRCNDKFPLKDVLDMMVEAAFSNLIDVTTARMILEGKIHNAPGKHIKEQIGDRELVMKEILSVIDIDLNLINTKYEYSVGMVKHERRTKPI